MNEFLFVYIFAIICAVIIVLLLIGAIVLFWVGHKKNKKSLKALAIFAATIALLLGSMFVF